MSVIYDPNKALPRRRQQKPARQPRTPRAPQKPGRHSPLLPRLVRFVRLVIILVVIGAVGLAGWLAFEHYEESGGSTLPTSQSGLPANEELVSPPQTYLSAANASSGRPLNLSFVAQQSWRSTRQPLNAAALLDPKDYQISLFSFTAGSTNLEPTGQLNIENVTNWVADDSSPKAPSYGGLTTHQTKQAYINYLSNLRQTRTVTLEGATAVVPTLGETGSRQLLQYVNSADSKLSGVTYVALVSSGGVTTPQVIADMAGVVDGQTIYAHLDIATSGTVNPVEFADGNISSAVSTLDTQATALVESLTLDTSQADAQAPAVSQ